MGGGSFVAISVTYGMAVFGHVRRLYWQGRKPDGKFGGTMTDCFRDQTSNSQNWPR